MCPNNCPSFYLSSVNYQPLSRGKMVKRLEVESLIKCNSDMAFPSGRYRILFQVLSMFYYAYILAFHFLSNYKFIFLVLVLATSMRSTIDKEFSLQWGWHTVVPSTQLTAAAQAAFSRYPAKPAWSQDVGVKRLWELEVETLEMSLERQVWGNGGPYYGAVNNKPENAPLRKSLQVLSCVLFYLEESPFILPYRHAKLFCVVMIVLLW